jgi:hypothetical protein
MDCSFITLREPCNNQRLKCDIKQLLPSMDVNIPLRVNISDVYNHLKAITVLFYRTTDQRIGHLNKYMYLSKMCV